MMNQRQAAFFIIHHSSLKPNHSNPSLLGMGARGRRWEAEPVSLTPSPLPGADAPGKAPPAARHFPCAKCGGRMEFAPESHALGCPYCGFVEPIPPSTKNVRERDWDEFWEKSGGEDMVIPGHSSQTACTVCGAVVLLDDQVAADKCPYCGSFLEHRPQAAEGMIAPGGALPFAISQDQARAAFGRWLAGRWFAPSQLYKFAALGGLSGVYVPFWTYDAQTFTHYTGERGDHYTETETYTERDASGQEVTKTRQVTKTRWSRVTGQIRHFFDDVLICGSRMVPEDLMTHVGPWDLPKLEDFRPEFLSGFHAERYSIGLRDGFEQAKAVMDAAIRQMCMQDIGGNEQQLLTVQTQHTEVTFKHILVPAWIAAYRYRDHPFQILVNGRTGKVAGHRPYSWVKISILVLVVLAVVALAILLFATRARGAVPPRPVTTSMHSRFSREPRASVRPRARRRLAAKLQPNLGS
jgi:DNA-directed RNA polymerase subunit RPC12/RpoP